MRNGEGHNHVWANLALKVKVGAAKKVAEKLVNHPMLHVVSVSLGAFDVIIGGHFKSMEELTDFINIDLVKIEEIRECYTSVMTEPLKYYAFYWIDKDPLNLPNKSDFSSSSEKLT